MRPLALLLLLALGACGVDGPPVPPSEVEEEELRPGITVTGSAEFGIRG
jgi:predicted small lipoprotein YifL